MTTVTAPTGISYSVSATSAPRLRLTVRGRRVLAFVAALPAVIALSFAMVAGGSAIAARDDIAPSASFETVTVMGGDTLWSLAADIAPTADPRDVVDAIARLNALDGVTIEPGQRLAIPAEYADAD
ncbi:MAG TPA: LysM peptidoglycan-binding domain-containing protein [Microbacterium sp.]|nr:LysM peptidoglycan-binding domain-containing protein [Microbacterium sp.]